MPVEPSVKRCMAFFDGQNLYRKAKNAFGYHHPNYDPPKLAEAICKIKAWKLEKTFFYTGIPIASIDSNAAFWNSYWIKKLAVMGTRNVNVFTRQLRYSNEAMLLPDGSTMTKQVGREKGIDVRLALDVVRKAIDCEYDVALIFSQDQDLSEAADEVKSISSKQNRWIQTVSAFPVSPTVDSQRGVNHTVWFKIEKILYDSCLDTNDYRPPRSVV